MNEKHKILHNMHFKRNNIKERKKERQKGKTKGKEEKNEIKERKNIEFYLVLCRLIEIIDNYRNLASIGSYRLEFSTID